MIARLNYDLIHFFLASVINEKNTCKRTKVVNTAKTIFIYFRWDLVLSLLKYLFMKCTRIAKATVFKIATIRKKAPNT